MSDERIPPGISTEDWSATPLAVRELVLHMLQRLEELEQQLAQLQERLQKGDPIPISVQPVLTAEKREPLVLVIAELLP